VRVEDWKHRNGFLDDRLSIGLRPGVGGSQKGNLRPSVSVHDELFNAPYKVADQHISPAALARSIFPISAIALGSAA
jgi:hypothetical protein